MAMTTCGASNSRSKLLRSYRLLPSTSARHPAACCLVCLHVLLLSSLRVADALSLATATLPPCIGQVTHGNTQITVIGTSHLRCQSENEVRHLIEQLEPDGVVVELDAERVIRLTKEGSKSKEQYYGADFLAAIDTAKKMDIPLFLGDENPKETRERFWQTVVDPTSYGPRRFLTALSKQRENSFVSYADLLRSFIDDPMKLAPLAAAVLPPLFLAVLMQATALHVEKTFLENAASTALSLLVSTLLACKVYNNLIADRDEILASSATRAAQVVTSLKKKEFLRARWTFAVNSDLRSVSQKYDGSTPLFTLKTPLETGKVRNLNLFEPRWLKMIDGVASQPSPLFGCLTCNNKFYSVIDVDGSEGRYADVIFERRGTLAELTRLVEGRRPVSGDRRVSAKIKGKDSFWITEDALSVSSEGYLVATNILCRDDAHEETGPEAGEAAADVADVKIVVVVGLLHANGIINQLRAAFSWQ